jgi:uncharacterized membrane protein YedE/YeeE
MKQFQIIVSIPPEEVVRRLSSAIQKPGLGLAVPFGGKDFFGTINGLSFQFRNRRRGSRNSFAPACFGNIQPNGYGSTINARIAAKNTLFLIFAIIFVLLVTFVSGSFGVLALLLLSQTSQPGPKDIAIPVLLFLIPLLAIAFLIGLFMIGKWMGRTDEARMNELLYQLFADVAIRPR